MHIKVAGKCDAAAVSADVWNQVFCQPSHGSSGSTATTPRAFALKLQQQMSLQSGAGAHPSCNTRERPVGHDPIVEAAVTDIHSCLGLPMQATDASNRSALPPEIGVELAGVELQVMPSVALVFVCWDGVVGVCAQVSGSDMKN